MANGSNTPIPISQTAEVAEKPHTELAQVEARAISKFAESSMLTLSEAEREILNRPVPVDELLQRPCKPHANNPQLDCPACLIYLDWGYTANLFDEAFGKGNWSLSPAPWNPKLFVQGNITYREYVLWIRGQFAANAVGHHEETRTSQAANFGDAAEATWANALTRCGKHLGVARDLWRKRQVVKLKAQMKRPAQPNMPKIIDVEPDLFDRLKCKLDGAGDIKALKEAWDAAMQWKSKLSAEDFASLEMRKNERKEEFK